MGFGVDRVVSLLVDYALARWFGERDSAKDYEIAAGTSSFTDWYLYTPKRDGAEREAFVAKLAPLDPINFLPKIAPRPVLLQFGSKDPHVKNDAAKAQADATKDPKTVNLRERRPRADVPGPAGSACLDQRARNDLVI